MAVFMEFKLRLNRYILLKIIFDLVTGIIAAIINPDASAKVKETCDGENICEDINLDANTSQIEVSIIPQYKSNIFLQCSKRPHEEPKCAQDNSVSFKYKRETDILQFCMKFNQTKHSENEMVIKRNEEIYLRILLIYKTFVKKKKNAIKRKHLRPQKEKIFTLFEQ